mgnify:CR=1 FL=1
MKADTGISGYSVKVAGIIISGISLIGFTLCKIIDYDPTIIETLHLTRLFALLFSCGLVLFVFSKDKNNVDGYIHNTNMISRYFLTALYSCLIAFNFIQSMNDDYTIDVLVLILFFLILQIIYTVVIQFHNLSKKSFYVFSTVIFVIGLILLLLL